MMHIKEELNIKNGFCVIEEYRVKFMSHFPAISYKTINQLIVLR